MLKYSQRADIKMVGVWDTVGSLGLKAFSIDGISRSSFDWLETGLRIHILSGYHALAIDEHRGDFEPTLWSVRHPKDPKAVIATPRSISNVEQSSFVGAHANVGGGYATDLLPQAPLQWMMKKAQSQGLAFRNEVEPGWRCIISRFGLPRNLRSLLQGNLAPISDDWTGA